MMKMISRRGLRAGLVLCLLTAALCIWTLTAGAAGGLELSTTFPGLTVNAGDSLSFPLEFDSTLGSGQSVGLSVASIPEGWEGYFTGNNSEITQVYVRNGENSGDVTFELKIPADAENGAYTVTLNAVGESGAADSLTLQLQVAAEEIGASSFTAQYPEQEGSSSATFSFDTTIANQSASEQTYSFSSNAPAGWTVTFQPAGDSTQVASLAVGARQSQGVTVTVVPPAGVEAGSYEISCAAVSAGDTLSEELSVVITGSYSMVLSTPSGLLSADASAGGETPVTLTLTNTSNTDLQNINLSSSAPDGWNVTFSESTVDLLEAGAAKEITAYITADEDALSGDYVVSISAKNSETADTAEFRISVKTDTVWGIVGVVLILAVVGGLGWVFHKYGRR